MKSLQKLITHRKSFLSLRTINRVFYLTSGVLVALIVIFVVLLFLKQRELTRTHAVRYDSYLLADELRQSSDDQTRLARTYVTTGDPRFERIYWETLAIRNGELPRPQHYERIYWERVLGAPGGDDVSIGAGISLRRLMERIGFTSIELAKLEEAELKSNQLVQSERIAFNAMKGLFQDSTGQFSIKGAPDPDLARRILFDQTYHQAKAAIMRPINEFYALLDTRTGSAVAAAQYRANLYIVVLLLLLGFLFIRLGLSYLIVRRKVENLVRLEQETRGIGAGTYRSSFAIDSRDEIGQISRAFVALDQKVAERTGALQQEVVAHSKAEVALRESQERYRNIFENARDIIYTHDLEGNYTSVNQACERVTGYSCEEILGLNFSQIVVPSQLAEIAERLSGRRNNDSYSSYELKTVAKDGSSVILEVNSRFIYEDGKPTGVQGIARDITVRKRAEAERQILAEIVQSVITTDNLDALFKLAHHEINKIIPAENCFIALHNLTTDLIQYEYWVDKFDPAPSPHPVDKGLCSHIMRTGQPLLLSESFGSQIHMGDGVELSGTDSPSWLGIPLRTGSRIIGVLVVQHYEKEHAYSQRDVEFLASVGDQLGLAIDRKQIALELKTNETKLMEAQTIAKLGSWEWDIQANKIGWSDELYRIYGLQPQEFEMTNEASSTYVHPDDRKLLKRTIKQILHDKVHPSFDYRILRPDGTVRILQANGRVTADDTGRTIKMVGTVLDITERMQVENALRQSEEKNRELIENANDIIYTIDLSGRFTSLNRSGERLTGYTSAEALRMNITDVINPDDAERVRQRIAKTLASELQSNFELEIFAKDGSSVTMDISSRLIHQDGAVAGIQGIGRDITERKRVDEKLRESEEKYRSLLETFQMSHGLLTKKGTLFLSAQTLNRSMDSPPMNL